MPHIDWETDVSEWDFYMDTNLPDETGAAKHVNVKGTSKKHKDSSVEYRTQSCSPTDSYSNQCTPQSKNQETEDHNQRLDNFPDHTPSKQSKRELVYQDYNGKMGVSSSQLSSASKDSCVPTNFFSQVCLSDQDCFVPDSITQDGVILSNDVKVWKSGKQRNEVKNLVPRGLDGIKQVDVWAPDVSQTQDLGYSSYSTDGYNQTDKAEMEVGDEYFKEPGGGLSQDPVEDGDLEDLLCQFEHFFKNRFKEELDNFRTSLGSVIEEQQSHIRQIVHTTIREQSAPSQTSADDLFEECGQECLERRQPMVTKEHIIHNEETGGSPSSLTNFDYETMSKLSIHFTQRSQADMINKKKDKLFELVTLSCSVSTLLAKHQFRS